MNSLEQFDALVAQAFEHVEVMAHARHPQLRARLLAVAEVCAAWADAIEQRAARDAAERSA